MVQMNKNGETMFHKTLFVSILILVMVSMPALAENETIGMLNLSELVRGGFGGGLNNGTEYILTPLPEVEVPESPVRKPTVRKPAPEPRQYIDTTDNPADPAIVDSRVVQELNETGTSYVYVRVKDTSGIVLRSNDTATALTQKYSDRQDAFLAKSNAVLRNVSGLRAEGKLSVRKVLESGRGFSANITPEALESLMQNPDVKGVYLNTPLYGQLDQARDIIGADYAESEGYTGSGQSVCLLDSGVDYNHSNLGDSCFGYGCKVRAGYDYVDDDANPADVFGHGTHVAGIISSDHSTYRGIAPDSQIIALRVLNENNLVEDVADVVDALTFCAYAKNLYNITVVSMSLGTNDVYNDNCNGAEAFAEDEIDDLYNLDMVVVAASGNGGRTDGVSYPACAPHVISVGATYDDNLGREPDSPYVYAEPGTGQALCYDSTTEENQIACLTNRQISALDLLAPGCRIDSTLNGGGFGDNCGTSMAAPMVSGAAVLLKEADPSITSDEIRTLLQSTGIPDASTGNYEVINISAALQGLFDADGDGYDSTSYGGSDCADDDSSINPGATEVCDNKDNDCDSTIDEGCETAGSCDWTGYDECYEVTYGPCYTKIGLKNYESANDIYWGPVNDAYDPYVIGQYQFSWGTSGADEVDYDFSTCGEHGCTGEHLANSGTKVTVTAPGTASRENVVSWADSGSYWCYAYHNALDPNYGAGNPLYVLNCYDNSDCSGSQLCNKTGTWDEWDCVSKLSDGQSCSSSGECLSGYCDIDNEGATDDQWCFTPSNSSFDGEESSYCEYSTGSGIAECDEKLPGTALNKCVGSMIFAEQCSTSCDYEDIETAFECDDIGCSCSEPLCDGKSEGMNVTTCAANLTYIADSCSASASGQDRNETICRSSSFGAGCTADLECNGVEAGTNNCDSQCNYLGGSVNYDFTFVGSDEGFIGYDLHNSTAGYIAETGNWSNHTISPDLNLSQLGYFVQVIEVELSRVNNSKIWLMSDFDYSSPSGAAYGFEDMGGNMRWVHLGDSYSQITGIPYDSNITITMYVNKSSDQTYSHLDWGSGSGTTANQTFNDGVYDYVRYQGGTMQGEFRIWSWQITAGNASGNESNSTPSLSISLVTPTASGNVTKDEFFTFTTQVCCLDADCGSVDVGLDPRQDEYTYLTEKHCEGDACEKTYYSAPRFGYEDGEWKPVENLRSFKNTVPILCNIQSDGIHEVECLDFNATYRKLRITLPTNVRKGTSVPIRILEPESFTSNGARLPEETRQKAQYNNVLNPGEHFVAWIRANLTDEIHVGRASTNITYIPNTTVLQGWHEVTGSSLAMYGWADCDASSYGSGDIGQIDGNDSNKIYSSGGGSATDYSLCHRYIWQIEENPSNITQIAAYARWAGSTQPSGADTITKALYIGNLTAQSWNALDIVPSAYSSVEHSEAVSEGINDYVNSSGHIAFLLHMNASKSGSTGAYSEFYYTELTVSTGNVSGGNESGGNESNETKSGLVSTTIGATPFYTTSSNPQSINLSQDQCQNVSWSVNATGAINSTHEFFAFANKTSDMSISNLTSSIYLTIVVDAGSGGNGSGNGTGWSVTESNDFTSSGESWSGGSYSSGSETYNSSGDWGTISKDYGFSASADVINVSFDFWYDEDSNDPKIYVPGDTATDNDYLLFDGTKPNIQWKHVDDNGGYGQCDEDISGTVSWTDGDNIAFWVNYSSGEWCTYHNGQKCRCEISTLVHGDNLEINVGNAHRVAIDNVVYSEYQP